MKHKRHNGIRHDCAGDLLLAEQLHRFCNSLQIVSAIVRQCRRSSDQSTADMKMDVLERRLDGLTTVHRLLSVPFTTETFANQTLVLARAFVAAFDRHDNVIVDFEPFWLPPKQRLRFALIIAELLTNSLKHSLRNKPPGWISVALVTKNEMVTLTVADSGRSLPATTLAGPSRIVTALATSIGAVADVINDDGYVARVFKPLGRGNPRASLTRKKSGQGQTGPLVQ